MGEGCGIVISDRFGQTKNEIMQAGHLGIVDVFEFPSVLINRILAGHRCSRLPTLSV